ncbi:nidogen-1-like, partial [Pholidichthys leucotaenia]
MAPGSWSRVRACSCLLALSVFWSRAVELEELFEFGEGAGDRQLPAGSDSTAELRLDHSVFFFEENHHRVSVLLLWKFSSRILIPERKWGILTALAHLECVNIRHLSSKTKWFCILHVHTYRPERSLHGIEGCPILWTPSQAADKCSLQNRERKGSMESILVTVNTNGFVAFAKPPAEKEYLGKMPSSFRMIAALMGDLDNSDGHGKVYMRQDSSPSVLSRAAKHINTAFPIDKEVKPINTFIVTWENMAAHGTFGQGDGPDTKRNTFQLVVAFMESSSYAILLYPRDHLQFLSTSVGGNGKLLEAGFNEGIIKGWWFNSQGTYFRITNSTEISIAELTKKTNSGRKGVWVYKIGSSPIFVRVTPGIVDTSREDKEATKPLTTMSPQQPSELPEESFSTYTTQMVTTTEAKPEENEEYQTEIPSKNKPTYPESETVTPGYHKPETEVAQYEEQGYFESETVTSTFTTTDQTFSDELEPRHSDETKTRYPATESLQARYTTPEPAEPTYIPAEPRYLDPEPVEPRYTNPEQVHPPHSHPQHPGIVVVDEDETLDVNVFSYNLETCARHRGKCSNFADCRDYSNGFCCHCRPGFYGDGKNCVAEGKPQRMNGKVNGRVFVGNSSSPVELSNNDLHSYVVTNDGRAYVVISNIPDSIGPPLQPLSSLGGVIGWVFALEQPGYENGFSLVGGVFSRQAEVIFQPGNERLSIMQQFKGIDEHDHLVMSTKLEGRLPTIPFGYTVQINSYKEIYHYDRNLITSSSNRDYTIMSPGGNIQTRSYQWRQTITFQSCPHDEAGWAGAVLSTQQLSVDQIFVMFDPDNHLIRHATTNKIGSVH